MGSFILANLIFLRKHTIKNHPDRRSNEEAEVVQGKEVLHGV
jgi:hypothetical protein